jgi:hypothetical protein
LVVRGARCLARRVLCLADKSRAGCFLKTLARENADLFVHWRIDMTGTFA